MEPYTENEAYGQLKILGEIGKTLTSTLDFQEVLRVIMKIIADQFEPRDWSLLLVDEESEELYFAIVVGEASDKLKDVRLKIGEGIAGWVAQHGQPLITEDASQDPRFAKWVDQKTGFETKSMVCLPLISKGRTLGVIELLNTVRGHFSERDIELLVALADFTAIAVENARYVKRIKDLSIVDDVTGLYNSRHLHALLETEISRAVRYSAPFSVIFLDLDYFKLVNDNHGHLVGSRLLREIGQVLRFNLRTVDWATRYGGDEFVLILPRTGRKEALLVAQRLRHALNGTVFLKSEKLNIRITASFGIATFPEDAKSKEDAIRLADQAMYRVKRSTRDDIAQA
ncbi:MAG: diguanylate cyclase [Deltaproteobacteria bacterium RBG_13_61_14]|nr:MAG: diguanylate cyclase [Deltaproteobacteria bacterium RBG_13_61_14]